MDFTSVIAQARSMLIRFIPAVFLIALLQQPWIKAHSGELLVRLFAHRQSDKHTYRRLHNVALNTPDGRMRIYHIFLSIYGILVLETKNISGWIIGSTKQAQWTQYFYKRTFKLQNPLRQNYKHLKALETALGINQKHLHSVITFIGGGLKNEVLANVTQGIGFTRYIKSCQQAISSETKAEAMLQVLQTRRRAPTLATQHEHVQNFERVSDPTAERHSLKVGNGFWGCSALPKCRTTQSL